ncbi:MAG: hypothetical protein V4764_02755 [Burkholderia sp.]
MNELDARNPHLKRDPRNYRTPYSYAEYPKWIELPNGQGVSVNNEFEEAVARGETDQNGEPRDGGASATAASALVSAASENAQIQSSAAPEAGQTAQGVVVRKAGGRPSKAEVAARAAREAAEEAARAAQNQQTQLAQQSGGAD